jgi:hypothetical protein
MDAVVTSFEIKIIGRTRGDVLATMDDVAFNFINDLGGEPWVRTDDDIKKVHQPQLVISDEQGFVYTGNLGMHFGGPFLDTGVRPQSDGHRVQNRIAS